MDLKNICCFQCDDNKHTMVKNGKTSYGKQRFICKNCRRSRVESYTYPAYHPGLNSEIIKLTKEGLGIRSTARVLGISTATLLRRIITISKNIKLPVILFGKSYEVDEMCTYIGNKNHRIWIVYALEKESKKIVSFNVGTRTNKTLKVVLGTLQFSKAKQIYTDGLKNYRYLIEKEIHQVIRFGTNHIERFNLNLRIHLKRLNRRTICFSRSSVMLNAILKIYFWGNSNSSQNLA